MAGLDEATQFLDTGVSGLDLTLIGKQIFGGIMWALAICMILGFIFGIYWLFRQYTGYKHTVILRNLNEASSSNFVQILKARVHTTKEGTTFWQTLKPKLEFPAPASEYIAVTKKGRWFAEGVFSDNCVTWVKPDLIHVHTRTIQRKDAQGNTVQIEESLLGLDHMSGTQRWGYMDSIKRAMKKRQDALSKWMQLLPLGAMIIIVVFGYMAFDEYKDTNVQTALIHQKTAELFRDSIQLQHDIAQKLEDSHNNIQRLESKSNEQAENINSLKETIFPSQEPTE